jgi:hypothetical protein
MLQLLVGRGGGYQEAVFVAGGQAPNDARAGDGAVADWDYVGQLGFEDGVEVFRGADCDEGVGVCQGREDADSEGRRRRRLVGERGAGVDGEGQAYSLEFSNCARTAMVAGGGGRGGM